MKPVRPLVVTALLAAVPLSHAATFSVSNLADSGAGSLRAAIQQANGFAGTDTIQFVPSLSGTITLQQGELRISDSIVLKGPGAAQVRIDGQGMSRVFRIENTTGVNKTFSIDGLTIQNGRAVSGIDDSGGGLFYENVFRDDQINLSNMVFTGNTAIRQGGAVSVSGPDITLTNVSMTGNAAIGGFQPSGGALHADRGLVRIERSRIVGNTAGLSGGGMRVSSPGASLILTDTLVQDNVSSLSGGGLTAGTMLSLRISRSAFVGNTTEEPFGGGIYFVGVADTGSAENIIENTTFSGNISQHQTGQGSALAVWDGNMTVRNSTFALNQTGPATPTANGSGGAVWLNTGGTAKLKLQSVLFANNSHGNTRLPIDLTRNTTGTNQSQLSVDHTAFQSLPAVGVITNLGEGNMETDALLLPLSGSQGGMTPIHPIARNSPVIDKGSNPGNLATDQRGSGYVRAWSDPRNPNGTADIGAYEFHADAIFFGDFEGL